MGKKTPTIEEADKLVSDLSKISRNTKEFAEKCNDCMSKFDFLVSQKLNRYRLFDNYDDLLQEGRIVLLNALKTYNPKKGCFYYWANRYIDTRIRRSANSHSVYHIPIKHARNVKPIRVNFPMNSMVDLESGPSDRLFEVETEKTVAKALVTLPDDQRAVISMFFEIGEEKKTISQICDRLEIDKRQCLKLIKLAKKNLCQELSESCV